MAPIGNEGGVVIIASGVLAASATSLKSSRTIIGHIAAWFLTYMLSL
ncbi:MAG: hypothetical protein MUO61_01310 [Dehalococcoidia bacterium]|nr:hypothetical protein [Dehalococcoidia bacterium]